MCPYQGEPISNNSNNGETNSSSDSSAIYASRIDAVRIPEAVNAGDKIQLEGSVFPSNAQDQNIIWSSDNPSVIAISSTGMLEAVGIGTAVISASTEKGTTSKFTITVNEVLADKIEIKEKPKKLLTGERLNSMLLSPRQCY